MPKKLKQTKSLIPSERILNGILFIRGKKVMLDKDLAHLYQVETRVLIQAVKRNMERFPNDFMFQLTKEEFENLIFQFGTSNLMSQFVISKQLLKKEKPKEEKPKTQIGFRPK